MELLDENCKTLRIISKDYQTSMSIIFTREKNVYIQSYLTLILLIILKFILYFNPITFILVFIPVHTAAYSRMKN